MDSISRMSHPRIIRGTREEDRLRRINATPYDAPDDQSTQNSLTASKRILDYLKSSMSGAVSAIKKHLFHESDRPLLKTIPLTQSVQFQPFPKGTFDGISSSIQQTISKPEYAAKYTVGDSQTPHLTKRPSLMGVVDFYKDVSTEKVRETMQRENSHSFTQSPDCQTRPVPVYAEKNTAIEASRRNKQYDTGRKGDNLPKYRKGELNQYNKRELHSILHTKEKPIKGNKKVSFVPELKRSSSSVIKYSSSDDEEESGSFYDKTRKQIFIDSNVVLKKEPTIQISLIKAKKLKPNPFHKKRLAEKTNRISEKGYQKQYRGEFDGKFNHENSFGSDHLINDSKVETDSDESTVHQGDSQGYSIYRTMGNKKNYNHFENSSDKEEQQVMSAASSHKGESPKLDSIQEEESHMEESQAKVVVESPMKKPIDVIKKQEEVVKPVEAPKTSMFANFGSIATPATAATEQKSGFLSSIAQEQPKEEKKTEVKSLFSGFNNAPIVPKETIVEKPIAAPVVETKQPETVAAAPVTQTQQPAQSSLFGGSSLFGKGNIGGETAQKTSSSLFGQKEEAPKVPAPVEQKVEQPAAAADPTLAKKLDVSEQAMADPIFSSIRNPIQSQFNDNPFLNPVGAFENPFAPSSQNKENDSSASNNKAALERSGSGILELFASKSQNQNQDTGIVKKGLVPVSGSISLFNNAGNEGAKTEQSGLFGNLSGGIISQKSMERQGSLLFGGDSNNNTNNNANTNTNTGMGASQNSIFGSNSNITGGLSIFGSNNNNDNTSNNNPFGSGGNLFGGNSGMGGGSSSSLFGGNTNTNNSGSGMGSMFGGNNNNNTGGSMFGGGSQSTDFGSNPFTASFGGGMGSGMGGGSFGESSGSQPFGSGQKRKNQKARAFN